MMSEQHQLEVFAQMLIAQGQRLTPTERDCFLKFNALALKTLQHEMCRDQAQEGNRVFQIESQYDVVKWLSTINQD